MNFCWHEDKPWWQIYWALSKMTDVKIHFGNGSVWISRVSQSNGTIYRQQVINLIWLTHKTWLYHWGRVTHICVNKSISIASDNGLSPGRRQVIIWTNAGILSIGPLGTNFSEILIEIQTFSLKKICLKLSSAKCRPFCLGFNVLIHGCRLSTVSVDSHYAD